LDHLRAKRASVGVECHSRVDVPELRLHFRRVRLFGHAPSTHDVFSILTPTRLRDA